MELWDNEYRRLKWLNNFNILYSQPETVYDEITSLASSISKMPIALISLLDKEHQFFKSHHGTSLTQTPLSYSFCAHAIKDNKLPLIINDARKDDRFKDNPLVVNDPHIVFYAGFPLVTAEGIAIGTLCVIDKVANTLNNNQIEALTILSNQVIKLFELRNNEIILEDNLNKLDIVLEDTNIAVWELNISTDEILFNKNWSKIIGYNITEQPNCDINTWKEQLHKSDLLLYERKLSDCLDQNNVGFSLEYRILDKEKNWQWVKCNVKIINRNNNLPKKIWTTHKNITNKKQSENDLLLLINNTEECFILLDKNLNIVTFNNQYATLYYQYFKKEVIKGTNILEYATKERVELVKSIYLNVLKDNTEISEFSIPDKDNNLKTFLIKYMPAKDDMGSITGAFVTISDITVEKQLQIKKSELVTELEKRNTFIESVLHNLPIGIAVNKIDDGKATLINKSFTDIYGLTKEEINDIESFFIKVYPDETYRNEIKNLILKDIKSGDPERMQWNKIKINTQQNHTKYINAKNIPIPNQNLMISTVVDVTKEYLQDVEIKNTKTNQEYLINGTSDLIWSIDVNYKLVTANSAFKKSILQATKEEIKPGDNVLNPKYGEQLIAYWKELYNRAFKGEKIEIRDMIFNPLINKQTYEHIILNPIYNNTNTLIGIACFNKDITNETEAYIELSNTQKELSKIMHSSLDMICTINEEGKFVKVSNACKQILGFEPDELINQPFLNFVFEEDFEKTSSASLLVKSGITTTNFENRYKHKSGEIVPLIWSAKWDEIDEVMYCVARDATDLVLAQENLKASEENYKNLFLNNPLPMYVWDFETKNIIDCNEEACLKYGYTKDEFLALNIREIRPQEDINELESFINTEENYGNIHKKLWRHKKKNGEIMHMEIIGHILNYNGRKASLVLANDVTDKLRADELKEFEKSQKEALINSTNDLIWSVDTNYNLIAANKAYVEEFKTAVGIEIKPGENILTKASLPPFLSEMIVNNFDKVFKGNIIDEELYLPKIKNRKESWAELTCNPIYNNNNDVIGAACFFKDITDKKTAEQKEKENYQRYLYVTKASFDAIWDWDIISNTIYWGDGYDELFGKLNQSEVPDVKEVLLRIHPKDYRRIYLSSTKAINGDVNNWAEEHRYLKADGNYAVVLNKAIIIRDLNGKATRVIGAMQDVTKQREDEQLALKVLYEKNTILESIGDAFFAVDTNWVVTYWNNMAEKLIGNLKENMIGKNFWEIFPEVMDTDFSINYYKAIKQKEAIHFEGYYEKLNAWYDVSAYPSDNGLSVYFRDISSRKATELKLKELNQSLVLQAKNLELSNKELEQFAYIASHDLQEPLRMITSFLAQLEKKYGDNLDEKAKKYIFFATDGAKRMRQIILDLLEFSRVGRFYADFNEQLNLNSLVNETLQLFANKIEETNAEIEVDNLPIITSNKTLIGQVFRNIISNSLKYKKPDLKPVIKVNCIEHNNYWEFSISDNGIGIAAEYHEKIFIIFQRLHNKEEYTGTGIGLAICKKIIDSLGGKIWVKSALNEGSTFYFTINKD